MTALDLRTSAGSVVINHGPLRLQGEVSVPPGAAGLVIFAHGSGSGRLSPRNRFVAGILQDHGMATLLFDLLTESEEREERYTGHLRFDIPLLAERLVAATGWVEKDTDLYNLPMAYFGASTGAGAALMAAAELGDKVRAVVSRGGRPDLAGAALENVRCPVLLIVGGDDTAVIDLNEQAREQMHCENALSIVPGATHLFEEPGALEWVAGLAAAFFAEKFGAGKTGIFNHG